MANTGFRVRLIGKPEAEQLLKAKERQVRKAMRQAARETGVAIAGRVKESFGRAGRPRRGTGRLSRGIRSVEDHRGDLVRVLVGVHASVPYGRLFELGGDIKAHDVFPVRKKVLAWTSGLTRLGQVSALGFGLTRKQAFKLGTYRKGKFVRAKFVEAGDVHFAKHVHIPARYQRAIPFLRPAFEAERPAMQTRFERRIAQALRGAV